MAQQLTHLSENTELNHLDIQKSVSDLDDARRKHINPLKQCLPLECKNIFIDILKFALQENKELIFTILQHITQQDREFDESTVIITAKLYMQIASQSTS